MAANSALDNVQYLDTAKFTSAALALETAIKDYNSVKTAVENTTTTLFLNWQGEGKTQFEKDYNTIFRQLTDIEDIMYELYEAIIDAEAAYIEADVQAGKILTMDK